MGDLKKSETYFNILQDIWKEGKEVKEVFKEFLTEERTNDLKLVRKQIKEGRMIEEFLPIQPIESDISLSGTEIQSEWELVKSTCKNINILETHLGKSLICKGIESPTGKNKQDRCDLLLIDEDRTLYPVEFKLKKATHAVVGQIGKYTIHYKLGLIKRTYDKVQGVVVANSYSSYAINELRKRGVICLLHSGNIDNLKISEIKSL